MGIKITKEVKRSIEVEHDDPKLCSINCKYIYKDNMDYRCREYKIGNNHDMYLQFKNRHGRYDIKRCDKCLIEFGTHE